MELRAIPCEALSLRLLRATAGCIVEVLVFFRGKPRTVRDLAGGPVGLRKVGKKRKPSVAICSLENVTKRDDFLMHRVPRRGFAARFHGFVVPMDSVLLNKARRDLRQKSVAKEWKE